MIYDELYLSTALYSLPAGHQQYHHNEENMSKACLHNYEVLVNKWTNMRLHLKGWGIQAIKTTPHDIRYSVRDSIYKKQDALR
jgi:hypothetical protein